MTFEYQIDLPPLFRNGFIEASLSGDAPLIVTHCDDTKDELWRGEYVFAVAVKFPEVADDITVSEILGVWKGTIVSERFNQLIIPEDYEGLFSSMWGAFDENFVKFLPTDEIVDELWAEPGRLAIISFDQIEPQMKILAVNDQNPLYKSFDGEAYPLEFSYCLFSDASTVNGLIGDIPVTNRDEKKMTTLLMTGVTALTRDTAFKMEQHGILYPADQIKMWFDEADIVHISNEVPFTDECPVPTAASSPSRFCSRTNYLELLQHINTDIIELTGNHLLDYGEDAFLESITLFNQNNLSYFGGGQNLSEASTPLLVEEEGNQFAFLGCNAAGPESVFATPNYGGANPCNVEDLTQKIQELSNAGYQVIVGIQHYEACQG